MRKQKRRVVVTAMGILNSNGTSLDEFTQNCMDGRVGIRPCQTFDAGKLMTDYVGEIDQALPYEIESLEQDTRVTTIFKELVQQMFEDTHLTRKDLQQMGHRACLSMATSVGSNDYIIGHVKNNFKDGIANNNFSRYAKLCGIKGPCYTNTSACAAGTTAAGTGYSLIRSGRADLVIVAGMDPLTEFSCFGFHSLQNMSKEPCKPFDVNRSGINIGEGGAILILEDYEHAIARKAKIYGEIYGYGLGNDAYHATSPDPTGNGALRVMKAALGQGQVEPNDIQYINAHGTGTLLNDEMEIKAIENLKSEEPIAVASTKSMTGHCLAGAGAVELVATMLCVEGDQIFPTATLDDEISQSKHVHLVKGKGKEKKIRYALSNSFAFGGNAASILVGKAQNHG